MTEHHKARRLALQGLCCLDVQGEAGMEAALAFISEGREDPATVAEAEGMLQGALARREEIDGLLTGESRHWDVARMGLVDRNILRLAVWELLRAEKSQKVVITEALRLAEEFAAAESSGFVNGVLDAVVRRIAETEESGHEE